MNVPGKEVAKALAPLRKVMIRLFEQTEHRAYPESRDETLIWESKEYPRVLRQPPQGSGIQFREDREA